MAKPNGRRAGGFLAGSLPEKQTGRHRWILSAVYPLAANEAAAVAGGGVFNLDPERFVAVPIVTCADCNKPFLTSRLEPCLADDAWRAIEPDTTDQEERTT